MDILVAASPAALKASLQGKSLLSADPDARSRVALVPAMVGMVAGCRVRRPSSEHLFRRLLIASRLALGAVAAIRSRVRLV